jgi:putative membrane protein
MNKLIEKFSLKILILPLIFFFGFIGHVVPEVRELIGSLSPYTLFAINLALICLIFKTKSKKLILWTLLTIVITFIIEAIGVRYGIIFGEYSYGNTLGFKIFDVPLIIGLNWVMVMLGAIEFIRSLNIKKPFILIFAPILTCLFDFFLEPVAIKLDYWHWKYTEVPLQNYLAWYLISLIATVVYLKLNVNQKFESLRIYFICQLIFFIGLRIVLI